MLFTRNNLPILINFPFFLSNAILNLIQNPFSLHLAKDFDQCHGIIKPIPRSFAQSKIL
jgi:hypothetical protein